VGGSSGRAGTTTGVIAGASTTVGAATGGGVWALSGVAIVLTMLLSTATSNTATANVMVPMMIAVAQSSGINAVPVAAVDIIRAAATDVAPLTSSLTPGTVVPIPTFPLPFTTICGCPPVLILTELLYFAAFELILAPIKSIQQLLGCCAVKRRKPVFAESPIAFIGITPLISFAVVSLKFGISPPLVTVLDINLMRGFDSVNSAALVI
jgi:hypothetical protein